MGCHFSKQITITSGREAFGFCWLYEDRSRKITIYYENLKSVSVIRHSCNQIKIEADYGSKKENVIFYVSPFGDDNLGKIIKTIQNLSQEKNFEVKIDSEFLE